MTVAWRFALNESSANSEYYAGSARLADGRRLRRMLIGLAAVAVFLFALLSYQVVSTQRLARDVLGNRAKLEAEFDALVRKQATLRSENAALEQEYSLKAADLQRAKDEQTRISHDIQRINGELAALTGRRTALAAQANEQTRLFKDSEHKASVAVQQRNRLESELDAAQKELKDLQAQIVAAKAELKPSRTKPRPSRPAGSPP
jgi:chromosome segregation ATPase